MVNKTCFNVKVVIGATISAPKKEVWHFCRHYEITNANVLITHDNGQYCYFARSEDVEDSKHSGMTKIENKRKGMHETFTQFLKKNQKSCYVSRPL